MIKKEDKRELIFQKFQTAFRLRGLGLNDNFDAKVWFLKDDPTFNSMGSVYDSNDQRIKKSNTTPMRPNKMCEVIQSINQIDMKSLKKISINVKAFISALCDFICESYRMIQFSESSIEKNNAHKRISIITETIKILKERIAKKNVTEFKSLVHAGIISVDCFPQGEYNISMSINNPEEYSKSNEMDLSDAVLSPKTMGKTFNQSEFTCNKILKINPNNEMSLTHLHGFKFDDFEFKILDVSNRKFVLDRNFSGTTFANFQIKCVTRGNISSTSKVEYLLDLAISYVDELCNISKENFDKRLNIKLKGDREMSLVLELILTLDDLTRCALLSRISDILSVPVEKKRQYENAIDEILDTYFPDISESIKRIMLMKPEEKRDACCDCRII